MPTIIYYDNISAVAIAKNPLYYKRTKHIDTKFHWIHKKVQIGRISVKFCHTDDQTANILTKPLTCHKHIKPMIGMGLAPFWRGVLGVQCPDKH